MYLSTINPVEMIGRSAFNGTIFRYGMFDEVLMNDFSHVLVALSTCWKGASVFKLFAAVTIVGQLIHKLDFLQLNNA